MVADAIGIELEVYRLLDNRRENLPDDGPLARELHERRRAALHRVLDDADGIQVTSWGQTDDESPHEWVTTVIVAAAGALAADLARRAVPYVVEKLADVVVEEGAQAVVKWFLAKLRPEQEAKKINDFSIVLPDGTTVRCDPPENGGEVSIWLKDGRCEKITVKRGPAT